MTWEKEVEEIKKREKLTLKHGGEESVKKHPFIQANSPPEIKDDGSVALN